MEKETKEFKISEEEYLKLKRGKEKTKALTIILIFTVIVMIGLIVLLCLGGKEETKSNNNQANNGGQSTNNNEKKFNNTFVYDENESYGVAYAKGYAEVKREYYCETVSVAECNESNADEINDVVYFHVTSTESEDLKKEIKNSYGGQSADSDSFTIGCVKDNIISFGALADDFYEKVNDNIDSTENYYKNIKLSEGDSSKIISSNANNPITLKFEKLKYTHGSLDFTTCISHMTSVEVVK